MRLEVFRSLWGAVPDDADDADDDTMIDRFGWVAHSGYDGVETPMFLVADLPRYVESATGHGLDYIAMAMTFGRSVEDHLSMWRTEVARAASVPHRFVVAHAGSDAWSEADVDRFFTDALAIAADHDVTVAFETHRSRPTFTPWATARLLERFPDMLINCDFSHWVVVAERLLEEEREVFELCAERAHHIHARVGHEGGPQVNDPAAPEWHDHLAAHEAWWELVWASQAHRGYEVSTLTPEWGPPPYQPTLPYSGEPIGDLAEICDWMADRQRARFATR
jgi:sugar phosphate isomerase/epimerase